MAFTDDLIKVTVTHGIADPAGTALPMIPWAIPTGRMWTNDGSIMPVEIPGTVVDGRWVFELYAVDQFINLEAYRIEERPTTGGKPWGRAYHIAPTLDHAPGPVDATDVITTPPRGGDIVFTAGPATDSSMAQVAADPNSEFGAQLKSTIGTEVDTRVPGVVGQVLAEDEGVRQVIDAAVTPAVDNYVSSIDVATGAEVTAQVEPVRSRSVEPLPLTEVAVTPRGDRPIPAEFFHGYLWGVDSGGVIKRSNDGGTTWQTYATVPDVSGNLQRLIPTSDGEMLAVATDKAMRSTGWASGTPTWTTVLENPTASYFYPWGVSGDGTKFIITHYSGSGTQTPDRADSRYAWISVDGGHTWTVKWDVVDIWDEDVNSRTHVHAAAYDPWEDRFFICEGHVEATGVYVSYDDGDTWQRLPYGPSFDLAPGNAPTVVVPTDYGVVFGSDDPSNGIMVLPRGTNEIQRAYSRMGITNTVLLGYAHMGARDPRTGTVYVVWELNASGAEGLGAQIMASDGQVANAAWTDTEPARRLWRRIAIDDKGNLLAWEQSTNAVATAKIGGVGARPGHLDDRGRVLGGHVSGGRGSVAVGSEAVANGSRSVAIGGGATTSTHDGLAIGGNATAGGTAVAVGLHAYTENAAVAVGVRASSANGTAVGYEAIAPHANATALGRDARAASDTGGSIPTSTAVGRSSRATGSAGEVTALGYQATASGNRSTALGSGATAVNPNSTAVGRQATTSLSNNATVVGTNASAVSARDSVALGYNATVTGNDSVALGANTTTSAASQIALGPRHLEIGTVTDPSAPAAGLARFYLRDNGGTAELCVRFPNGTVKVITNDTPAD